MKVTKEQKVYLGLLAVGLVALAVDRLALTPASAEAADSPQSLLIAKSPDSIGRVVPLVSDKTAAMASENPLSQKLTTLSESMHLSATPTRDAFTPAPAWTGKSPVMVADLRGFEQSHSLTGVMVSGQHPVAMIDGKLISVGQVIDGYKLVSVTQGTAVLQAGEISVTLHTR